jgi:hypothetical protein
VVAGQEDAHLLVDADVGDEPLVRGQGGLRYGVARVRCLEQRARELDHRQAAEALEQDRLLLLHALSLYWSTPHTMRFHLA